jgi:putative DNA methylase
MTNYPERLIEVDLPIRRISAHARREKSTRRGHGHGGALHIWWARRARGGHGLAPDRSPASDFAS